MPPVLCTHTLLPLIGCVSFPQGTNINDAVLAAVSLLVNEREQGNLPERSKDMIILLTDGMPNMGKLHWLTECERLNNQCFCIC